MKALASAFWRLARPYIRRVGDGLGYGLQWWEAQWFPSEQTHPAGRAAGHADMQRAALVASTAVCLDVEDGMRLPFRLYGALVGARLATGRDAAALQRHASKLLKQVNELERKVPFGGAEHSGINKVMMATALDPWAFARLPDEPVVQLED